jgi:hypothetical protein
MHDLIVVFGAITGWEFMKWLLSWSRLRKEK